MPLLRGSSYESDVSIYTPFVTHLEDMNHKLTLIFFGFKGKSNHLDGREGERW